MSSLGAASPVMYTKWVEGPRSGATSVWKKFSKNEGVFTTTHECTKQGNLIPNSPRIPANSGFNYFVINYFKLVPFKSITTFI